MEGIFIRNDETEPVSYTGEKCKLCLHSDLEHTKNGHCHHGQHGALLACRCIGFVSPTLETMRTLSWCDQKRLACADYLFSCPVRPDLSPDMVSRTEIVVDDRGRVTGLNVVVHIPIDGFMEEWVEENLPQQPYRWLQEYLIKKRTPTA